jgi:hypothetical protein
VADLAVKARVRGAEVEVKDRGVGEVERLEVRRGLLGEVHLLRLSRRRCVSGVWRCSEAEVRREGGG